MPSFQGRDATRALYRRLAVVYDVVRPLFVGTAATRERYFDRLDLAPEDHVLDLGCGTGVSTRRLAGMGGPVHGIDLSAPQLARARDRAAGESGADGDATFVLGDATRLPYRDGVFDAAVSIGTLPYVPEPLALLAEAHRVCAPGGQLLAVGPERPASPVKRRLADALVNTFEPDRARELARTAGWQEVAVESVHMDWLARDALVVTGRV